MSRVSDGHEYDRKNRASASERQAHFIVPGARYIRALRVRSTKG